MTRQRGKGTEERGRRAAGLRREEPFQAGLCEGRLGAASCEGRLRASLEASHEPDVGWEEPDSWRPEAQAGWDWGQEAA